jgi:hypothetical protein
MSTIGQDSSLPLTGADIVLEKLILGKRTAAWGDMLAVLWYNPEASFLRPERIARGPRRRLGPVGWIR